MEARTLLMVAVGFLIGNYFLNQRRKKAVKDSHLSITPKTDTTTVAQQLVDDAKTKMCKENWIRFSQTRKFASAEAMQNTYDNFMTNCVATA